MFKTTVKSILLLMCFVGSAFSDEISIAVGLALPPYVISQSNTGMELDIVREALKVKGHTAKIIYLPFKRVVATVNSGKADAALTVNEGSGLKYVHYTNSHITYQNVAIGLKKNKLSVTDVSSLGQYSINSFQDATKYLGPEFSAMAKGNKRYKENAKQDIQTSLLYSGRVELIVLDINIFKYYKSNEKRVSTDAEIDIFEVFSPTDYKVGFISSTIKDDFNVGLDQLKKSGRYQAIIDSYIK